MNVEEAAQRLGLTERTISRAVKENRIRHLVDNGGNTLIPDDEIKPLSKAQIQAFLWMICKAKNEPEAYPDPSTIPDVNLDQLQAAFKQLVFRKYIDRVEGGEPISELCANCRITEAGMALINRSALPGVPLGESIRNATFPVLFSCVGKLLLSLVNG